MRVLLAAGAALALLAGAAQAAGLKTVGDWDAACSNTGACAAFGFAPQDAEVDDYLIVRRAAGPDAAPGVVLVFDPGDKQPSARWTLTLDGHPIPGVGPVSAKGGEGGARAEIAGPAALALIEALRDGKALAIEAGGKAVGSVSLAGSAAILLWVDAQQGRVGTVTALVRKGPKPASAVPPPPPAPLVVAAPPISQAGLPKTAPRSLIANVGDCDLDPSITPDDIVARLSPGVVLWGPECDLAAYNETSIFFLGDEHARHLRPLSFPEAPGAGEASDDELVNVSFEPKTQTLSIFDKGRGVGDCGEAASWVWDGKAFKLASEFNMPDCRGVWPGDWPRLFVSRGK